MVCPFGFITETKADKTIIASIYHNFIDMTYNTTVMPIASD